MCTIGPTWYELWSPVIIVSTSFSSLCRVNQVLGANVNGSLKPTRKDGGGLFFCSELCYFVFFFNGFSNRLDEKMNQFISSHIPRRTAVVPLWRISGVSRDPDTYIPPQGWQRWPTKPAVSFVWKDQSSVSSHTEDSSPLTITTTGCIHPCLQTPHPLCLTRFWRRYLLLRGAILNRTYGKHKNLYMLPFLRTKFGPIYYGPPE